MNICALWFVSAFILCGACSQLSFTYSSDMRLYKEKRTTAQLVNRN